MTDTPNPTSAMLYEVGRIFDDYLVFPSPEARDAVVLWTAHTHVYRAFEATPRLAVVSNEPGSGKSRVLELIEHLAPGRPMLAVNIHPAILWRYMDAATSPVLLLDEIDTIFGRGGSGSAHMALRSVLNQGHRSSGTVYRCQGTDGLREFGVYAPVAMAGLGTMPETIMTRSVVIRMRKRRPSEQVRPFRYKHAALALRCARFTLEEWAADWTALLELSFPELPVKDRSADVWEPLVAIADLAGEEWHERAVQACTVLTSGERKANPGETLLRDLFTVFGDSRAMFSAELLNALYEHRGDLEWTPESLDPRILSRILSEYGVRPTTVRRGEQVAKGYRSQDLVPHWKRLGLLEREEPEGGEIIDVTDATEVTV